MLPLPQKTHSIGETGVRDMSDAKKASKLILAVLQKEDFKTTQKELNEKKIFVTRLSSSGGFLQRENVTIMIGVEEERWQETMDILKKTAGRRRGTIYAMPEPATATGNMYANVGSPIPIEKEVGGITIFTMQLDELQKF